jgi:hypothetical protein
MPGHPRVAGKAARRYNARMERRVVMTRVLRAGQADDGAFDLEFWRRVGAEGIFAAAWEMVGEQRAIRGKDGDEPRLQRSVVRVVRRGR